METWRLGDREFTSRLMVGTGKYRTPAAMQAALEASGAEVVTVAVRRMDLEGGDGGILEHLDLKRYTLLPNTAGARTAAEAVRLARLARAAAETNLIKLEVIGDPETLLPDVVGTLEATRTLVQEDFTVLCYTAPDPVLALQLEEAGAAAIMPYGSLIGSGQGIPDFTGIRMVLDRVRVPVVVDAGLGAPSDAALAMELGATAVLINTAIALAADPAGMATAMKMGVQAGRKAFLSGRIPKRSYASASSPTTGLPG